MSEIPRPQTLDAGRPMLHDRDTLPVPGDLREEVPALRHALRESCEYAGQLWEQLQSVREFLVRMLPPSPGFTDERGWQDWTDTYTAILSTLAGPRGDSGWAHDEARRLVRDRRDFPAGSTMTPETVVRTGRADG